MLIKDTPKMIAFLISFRFLVQGGRDKYEIYWNPWVVMMSTLLSPVTLQDVVMSTCSVTSDKKVGILTTLDFQWQGWF